MQRELLKHPSMASPLERVSAEAFRFTDGRVTFTFMAAGNMDRLVIPAATRAGRKDELWRHTCFEAFVRSAGEPYIELNFSPSGEWAAYRFDRYRRGMAAAEIDPPQIRFKQLGPMLTLTAEVELGPVAELAPWQDWQVGLAAVIEGADGSRSYWALAHPPGDPDFHHPDCFAAELAPDASL